MQGGQIIKGVLKTGKKHKKNSRGGDRRSSWASPLSSIGAANISVGSSVNSSPHRTSTSSTPSSSGWSKPEQFRKRCNELELLVSKQGFKRVLTRLISNNWSTDMRDSQLYYFAPGFGLARKGEQGKDWFNKNDRDAMLACVAKSKKWYRIVAEEEEDDNLDAREVSAFSEDYNSASLECMATDEEEEEEVRLDEGRLERSGS